MAEKQKAFTGVIYSRVESGAPSYNWVFWAHFVACYDDFLGFP